MPLTAFSLRANMSLNLPGYVDTDGDEMIPPQERAQAEQLEKSASSRGRGDLAQGPVGPKCELG